MLSKVLIFILLLSTTAFADHIPIGHKKWRMDDGRTRNQLGGQPRNYQKPDKSWAKIDNNFVAEGDSVLKSETAVLKTRINKNGTVTVKYTSDSANFIATQRLVGIGWINVDTKARQWIDSTIDFSNLTTSDSIAKWTGVSGGVDYWVIKRNGSVAKNIRFKPAFVDSAVALYDQRTDSLDLALANVMEYSFSNNIDNADSAIGTVDRRTLKAFADEIFELQQQEIHWTNDTTDNKGKQSLPVKQRWIKQNGKIYCVEYMMMSTVKEIHEANPTSTIWHNTSTQIDDPDIEDAGAREDAAANGFGTSVSAQLYGGTGAGNRWAIVMRVFDLDNELPAGETIDYCSLYVDVYQMNNAGTQSIYAQKKINWVEGTGANTALTAGVDEGFNLIYWDCNASFDQTSASGGGNQWFCEQASGTENTADGGACNNAVRADYNTTLISSLNITATGENVFDLTSMAQAENDDSLNLFFDGGDATNDDIVFATTEHATETKPYFIFITSAAGGTTSPRRRKMIQQLGDLKDEKDIMATADCGCPDNSK